MKIKTILAWMLAVSLLFGLCGCGGAGTAGSDGLVLWAEPSGIKYMRSDDGAAAKTASEKSVLKVQMAKNETEAVQLMMYANKKISCYDVAVSDLVCGNAMIPAENVEIWDVLYQASVTTSRPGNPDFAGGYVPDPLLPMETSVEYGETVIEAGDNQAVLLDISTTAGTAAGVYKGTVTVTADEKQYNMPIEVTVHDIDLTGVEELRTAFSWFDRDHLASAELDSSDELMKKYVDLMLKYNMSCKVPFEGNGGIERYVELIREYYHKDGFTAYALYYEPTGSGYNGVKTNVNLPLLKEYIRALVHASVEDGINYLDKAYSYFYTDVDEPASEQQFLDAKQTIDLYFQMLFDCDTELREEYVGTLDYDYYVNVISPVLVNIPDVIPGAYDVEDVKAYGLDNLTVCPVLHAFATPGYAEAIRESRDYVDVWMYTCWSPTYPFPNAHTDDLPLSTRVLGWMCYELDTPTYLMWATSCYTWQIWGEPVEDAWVDMHTGEPSAGDGKLTYPGAKYGIDGPCPSLRMVAYRDMSEDYQLLNVVRDLYAQQGLDAITVLEPMFRRIYSTGLIPNRDVYAFEQVRTELFEMILNLQAGTEVFYAETDIGVSQANIAFKAPQDAKILVDGQVQTPDDQGVYRFCLDLTQQKEFTFQIQNGEKVRTVTRTLVDGQLGQVQSFENPTEDYSGWISCFGKNSGSYSDEMAQEGSGSMKIEMNPNAEDALPFFALTKDSQLIGGSWKDVKKVKLYVYNPESETTLLSVSYYVGKDVSMASYELQPDQWTLIELTMPTSAEIEDVDSIEEIDFNFQRGTAVTVYVDSLVTVKEAQ